MKWELSILPPGQASQGTQRTHMPLPSYSAAPNTDIFFNYTHRPVSVSLEQNTPVTHTGEEKKIQIDFITVFTK